MDDDRLWSAYQQVVFRLLEPLPTDGSFMILTADYPRGRLLDQEDRLQRQRQLYKDLSRYSEPKRLQGCSADGSHCEPSFAVSGIARDRALYIAAHYQQNAIYQVSSGHLYLVACLIPAKEEVYLGFFGNRIVA